MMTNEEPKSGGVVFFGPWVGEFGWELMTWQAWCREQAKKFDKVYTCSFPDMEYLYYDFSTFIPHRHKKRKLDWTGDAINDVQYELPGDVTRQFAPFKTYRVEGQDFARLGRGPSADGRRDILIHARGINKGNKNYPVEKWEKLVEVLGNTLGPVGMISSVGTSEDHHVRGTIDCRGMKLDELCDYIAQAKVVIGQSSGVMHLASLCETPHVVWGDGKTYFGQTLEVRYAQTWNPFRTPVYWITDENWDPPVDTIRKMVAKCLERTSNFVWSPMLDYKFNNAQAGGKYFITVTKAVGGGRLEHFWQSKGISKEDHLAALKHLIGDVEDYFKKQRPDMDIARKGLKEWQ